MSDKTWTRNLTIAEMRLLEARYKGQAKYQLDCEQMQKERAQTPNPNRTFISDPLADQPQTAENWLARANIFRERAQALIERANYFSVTED